MIILPKGRLPESRLSQYRLLQARLSQKAASAFALSNCYPTFAGDPPPKKMLHKSLPPTSPSMGSQRSKNDPPPIRKPPRSSSPTSSPPTSPSSGSQGSKPYAPPPKRTPTTVQYVPDVFLISHSRMWALVHKWSFKIMIHRVSTLSWQFTINSNQ